MAKEKRERTDAEQLDDAIVALESWALEIEEELNRRGYGERYLREVLEAARRVHDRDQ